MFQSHAFSCPVDCGIDELAGRSITSGRSGCTKAGSCALSLFSLLGSLDLLLVLSSLLLSSLLALSLRLELRDLFVEELMEPLLAVGELA